MARKKKRNGERKIESGTEADSDRDGASERVAGVSEKNAKMHAAGRGGAKRERVADSMRTERASEQTSEPREGGYIPRRKERQLERGTVTREESGGRADTNGNGRRREGRATSARGDRESTGTGRTWACERERNRGMKKREGVREEREAERYREGAKERGRARG